MLIRKPGETTYLFVSTSLLALAENLYRQLSANDTLRVPVVKRTFFFPYRLSGKACFLVGGKSMHSTVTGEGFSCSKCGPRTDIDRSNRQRMLEHMGTHILYDSTISRSLQVCGLCLPPTPMCMIYLKGCGGSKGYSVDMNRSNCVNLI
jgi:hypothetical protein